MRPRTHGATGPSVSAGVALAYPGAMSFAAVSPDAFEWLARPHEPGEPARHVAELSDRIGLVHTRANMWRYEPGATGRRHRHREQEETFVVLSGTLTIYVGEPAQALEVPTGGVIRVGPGTALQSANRGSEDLVVFAYGTPPETESAELLDSAV
jgi:quercetin dioxygenase-like cupin family protein